MLIFRIKLGILKNKERRKCKRFLKKSLRKWRKLGFPACIYFNVKSKKVFLNAGLEKIYSEEFETEKGAEDFFRNLKQYLKTKFSNYEESQKYSLFYSKAAPCWLESSNKNEILLVLRAVL